MYSFNIIEKTYKFEIIAQVILLGSDIVVVVSGGKEHIGAIGVAQPRQSRKDKNKISSTSSVFTFLGHKEDIIVKAMSEGLSSSLNRNVVVIAGIHWDNIQPQHIDKIIFLCKRVEERIIEEILCYEKNHCGHNGRNRGDIRD